MSKPDVLVVAKLWPPMMEALQTVFTVHDRTHESDPAAFAKIAPSIRAISGAGESKVPASLIAQLPALEMISVFGVGYDGYDVAAARARGVPITNTPDVLTDEVADMGLAMGMKVVGFDPALSIDAAWRLSNEVQRQAAMIGYINAFYMMTLTAAVSVPLALFLRRPSNHER